MLESPERVQQARAIKERWVKIGRVASVPQDSFERIRMQYYIAHRILRRADFGIDHPDNSKYLANEMGLVPWAMDLVARAPKIGENVWIEQA